MFLAIYFILEFSCGKDNKDFRQWSPVRGKTEKVDGYGYTCWQASDALIVKKLSLLFSNGSCNITS
ncbi:MAG: hypothetical protein DRP87_19375 [Spirochaetes bacterium]|nr:MAG: hypothetical protein DRP87_19375 [Spirochaetota bacterium]